MVLSDKSLLRTLSPFMIIAASLALIVSCTWTPPGPGPQNYIDRTFPAYNSGIDIYDTVDFTGLASEDLDLPASRLVIHYTRDMDTSSFDPTDDMVIEKCTDMDGAQCFEWEEVPREAIIPNVSGTFFGGTWLSVGDASTVLSYVWDFTGCTEGNTVIYDRLTIFLNNTYLQSQTDGTLFYVHFLSYDSEHPERGVNPVNATQTAEGSIKFRVGHYETNLQDLPYIAELKPSDMSGEPGSTLLPFPPHEEISVLSSETLQNFLPMLTQDGSQISGGCNFLFMNQYGSTTYELGHDTRLRVWRDCGLEPNKHYEMTIYSDSPGLWSALTSHPATCAGIGAAGLEVTDLLSPWSQDLSGARIINGGTPEVHETVTGNDIHYTTFLPPIQNVDPFSFTPSFQTSPVRIDAAYVGVPVLSLLSQYDVKVMVASDSAVDTVTSEILGTNYQDAGIGNYTCGTISGNSTVCSPDFTSPPVYSTTYIMRFSGLDGATVLGFDQMSVKLLVDTDLDGMPDYWESLHASCLQGLTPDDGADPDLDGLTNLAEYQYSPSMNPCSNDTDGDGLTDYDEINVYGSSPILADTDRDGMNDGLEVLYGTNFFDSDSDNDGIPDGVEVCYDGDCDTYSPSVDCNPLDPDTDDDGINDGYEVGQLHNNLLVGSFTKPINPDSDGDGQDDLDEFSIGNDPNRPDNPDYYQILPNVVQPGSTVTLSGRRFGSAPSTNCEVHLNGEVFSPESSSDDFNLIFVVPEESAVSPWTTPQLYMACLKNGLVYQSPGDLNLIVVDNSSSLFPYDEKDTMTVNTSVFSTIIYGYIEDQEDLDSVGLSLPQGGLALISAVAIDPATGATIDSAQELDLGLRLYSSGQVELYGSEDGSPENLNPAPIFAVLGETDDYNIVLAGKEGEEGFYQLTAEVKTVPFITGLSPILAPGGATLEITGVNFANTIASNEVVLIGPQDSYTCVITSAAHDLLKVTTPSSMTVSASGYEVKVSNLTSGYDTEDLWAAPYRQNYFFYPFTASAPLIPDGRAGTADLAFGVEGTAHTGTATGQFSFAGLAGQAVNVHIQLVTDGGTVMSGAPDLTLYDPEGNALAGTETLDEPNGILEVDFTGAGSMPMNGAYSLIVDYTGGSAYRIELTDLTDLLDATEINAVSSGYTAVDPETETVTLTVQAAGGAVLEGVPIAFNGTESGFTLTESNAQASMAIVPPPPGTYEHVLVTLATAPQTGISFTIYTRQQSSQQMGMMSLPAGSIIDILNISGEPLGTAGVAQTLTINAYGTGSLEGATVTLTAPSNCQGHFAGSAKTIDVALDENGTATVQFTPGEVIACSGCRWEPARRDNETYFSLVGINQITGVVPSGQDSTVTASFTVKAFPGEATYINIKDRSQLNNTTTNAMDRACCSYNDSYYNTAIVTDTNGNPVANHDVQFVSNDTNLTLTSDAISAGIIIPTSLDSLPVASSQAVTTDSYGYANVIWLMPRHTTSANLSASLTGGNYDTDSLVVYPASYDPYPSYRILERWWWNEWNFSATSPWQSGKVLPYPLVIRLFNIVQVGPYWVLEAHPPEGTILFDDNGTGTVGTSPYSLPNNTVTVSPDNFSQAQAYWAPATGSPNPRLYYTWSGHSQAHNYDSMLINTQNIFSATVERLEGATVVPRTLSSGGVALVQEKEVVLSITRQHVQEWWLKVETQSLPNGKNIPPFVGLDADPWIKSGNAYYYLLPYSLTTPITFTVRLPLNGVSDGASVTVKAVYPKNLWSEQNSGPPTNSDNEGVLAEFKFKVGSFKIKSIDFISNIDMYSGLAQQEIVGPEWKRNSRTKAPTFDPWDEQTTAPTIIKVGDELLVRVNYECHGLSGANLSATCDTALAYTPNCLSGNITSAPIDCSADSMVMLSSASTTSVSASMSRFNWNISGSQFSTPLRVSSSTFRIYSILSSMSNLIYKYYIELAEIALVAAQDDVSCKEAAVDITNTIWEQSWKTTIVRNKYRFHYPLGSINYSLFSNFLRPISMANDATEGVYNLPSRAFESEAFLSEIQNDLVYANCFDINGFLNLAINLAGCHFENNLVAYDHGSMVSKTIWLLDPIKKDTVKWARHVVAVDPSDGNIFDSNIRLGESAIPAVDMGQTVYRQNLLTNTTMPDFKEIRIVMEAP